MCSIFSRFIFFSKIVDWNFNERKIWKKGFCNHGELRVFYKALIQYQNPESKKLILKNIKSYKVSIRETHSRLLLIALYKYNYEYFNDIVEKINFDEYEKNNLRNDFQVMMD